MPSSAFIVRKKSMPDFKALKDRLTPLLDAKEAGDFNLKPMLIYRSENFRAVKNCTWASYGVVAHHSLICISAGK